MPGAAILAAVLEAGLRAFLAATFATRSFGGAIFDPRLERRERDFDAMILPV
jgi:hypothetical protein